MPGEGVWGSLGPVFLEKVFLDPGVTDKHVPMDLIHRDQSVCSLYIEDKLTRQSTHGLLKSLVCQLEGLVPDPLVRGKLAPDVLVQAHTSAAMETTVDDSGELMVTNASQHQQHPVFPETFNLSKLLVINHTIDRGSIGGALLHFMIKKGYLWCVTWGFFHDVWNTIKTAAKKTAGAKWWNMVVKFASVSNMNHGPFRSSAWGKGKQQAHRSWMETHTYKSPEFRAVAVQTAKLHGKTCTTEAEFLEWWQFMGRLPSCVSAGPVLKFARWHGIETCWNFMRPEMWMLREVLLHMNPQQAQRLVEAQSTQMWDAELAEKLTTSKDGLIVRAPGYITQSLIDVMDMFVAVAQPFRNYSKHRLDNVQNVEESLKHQLECVAGSWENVLIEVVQKAFCDHSFLSSIGACDGGARGEENIKEVTQFALNLMTQWCMRVMPQTLQYPGTSVEVLSPLLQVSKEAKLRACDHLCI